MENELLPAEFIQYLMDNGFTKLPNKASYSKGLIKIYIIDGDLFCTRYGLVDTNGDRAKAEVYQGSIPYTLHDFKVLMFNIGFIILPTGEKTPEEKKADFIKACELNIEVWEELAAQHEHTNALQYSIQIEKAGTGRKLLEQFKSIYK